MRTRRKTYNKTLKLVKDTMARVYVCKTKRKVTFFPDILLLMLWLQQRGAKNSGCLLGRRDLAEGRWSCFRCNKLMICQPLLSMTKTREIPRPGIHQPQATKRVQLLLSIRRKRAPVRWCHLNQEQQHENAHTSTCLSLSAMVVLARLDRC